MKTIILKTGTYRIISYMGLNNTYLRNRDHKIFIKITNFERSRMKINGEYLYRGSIEIKKDILEDYESNFKYKAKNKAELIKKIKKKHNINYPLFEEYRDSIGNLRYKKYKIDRKKIEL